jgi:hypothetical protein
MKRNNEDENKRIMILIITLVSDGYESATIQVAPQIMIRTRSAGPEYGIDCSPQFTSVFS